MLGGAVLSTPRQNEGRKMNRDTRLSDVLHVMLHMDKEKRLLTSDVLARSMGTNPAVFRRTMAGLREAGLVRSERGHGGGWQLTRPLREITLLDVYDALGRPNLFAIGNRSQHAECRIEKNVNAVLVETLAAAATLFATRFKEITLDQVAPRHPVPTSVHADR
jgi:Rrf2 family protein